jgi:hypothetical protein
MEGEIMRKFQDMVIASRMVRVVASASVLLVSLLVSMTAWGQTAYVTDGSGQDILAVSSGTVSTVATVAKKFGVPTQVRVGGDNLLYVITPTNILRMTTSGANLQTVFAAPKNGGPTGFTGIRFDSSGNLYANTSAGVYVIKGVVQATTSFASPSHLTTASCSPAGDLAFTADGDLLIACNGGGNAVYRCSGVFLPASCTPAGVANISGPVTGLAVDSLDEIVTSSGSEVTINGAATTSVPFGADVPAYLEAVPDPSGASATCNSASPSILVSTAIAGKNGKVWSLDTVDPSSCSAVLPLVKPASPLATLSSTLPAVGLAAPGTLHTLNKNPTGASPTSDFNFGPTSLELSPVNSLGASGVSDTGCPLAITKEQLSVPYIAGRLANNDANLPVSAISLFGEQGWVTGFHGAYPAGCLSLDYFFTHIGISGFYTYLNPHIVIIPDDTTMPAHVDELPFVFPLAPLNGNPGDPRIINLGTFSTTPATIIAADVGFTSNAPAGGYLFCGFLSPFVDPATGKKNSNLVNSGQSATFKFQLGTTSCSKLVDPSLVQNIHTGFSVAKIAGSDGVITASAFKIVNNTGKGSSVSPPTFKFNGTGNQFVYTLDTTGYCNGVYEATANGDVFQPHMLQFTIIGAPSSCQ